MSGVLTLAATVAAAAGAVAAYRFMEKRGRNVSDMLRNFRDGAEEKSAVIDYEQDPETGVYRPRD